MRVLLCVWQRNDDEAVVDRGGTRSQQRANFEQEDFEGTKSIKQQMDAAAAPESTHSAFLFTDFFLLVKDKSRVGGRNCGGAEFASAMITQKNTDDQNKDTNSVQLKVTKGQELYPSTYADIEGNEQLYNLNSCLSFWQ